MYFGYELGDLAIYFVSIIVFLVSSIGMGFKYKFGPESRLFFSLVNIGASVFLLVMFLESNLIN